VSVSSGDELPYQPSQATYTSSHPQQSASHRRQIITRPVIDIGGSNLDLDSLKGQSSHILHVSESPVSGTTYTPNSSSHPSFTQSNYPRARRKSVSQSNPVFSDDDKEGGIVVGPSYGKGVNSTKKKRRTSSFTLPVHRRKRNNTSLTSRNSPSRLRRVILLFVLLIGLVLGLYTWHKRYQIQVEFSVFSRRWISEEIDVIPSLKGCFNPNQISPEYNLTHHLAPNFHNLSPGIPLRRGMSCYDFSSTIQPIPNQPLQPLLYHTYWRSDLIPFGPRHTALLTSFLATQPLTHSKLILWTNGLTTVANNEYVKPFVEKWGEYIEVRQVEMAALTVGTDLNGIIGGNGKTGGVWDEKGWVDGDAVRLLVLWHHGGVWLDMDMILTRDLHPLVEQEFVTQWDCYGQSGLTAIPPTSQS
jgi:hypothetical protein